MTLQLRMNFALESVKSGSLSAGQAARQFNVPETTLREYLKRSDITAGIVSFFCFMVALIMMFLHSFSRPEAIPRHRVILA